MLGRLAPRGLRGILTFLASRRHRIAALHLRLEPLPFLPQARRLGLVAPLPGRVQLLAQLPLPPHGLAQLRLVLVDALGLGPGGPLFEL